MRLGPIDRLMHPRSIRTRIALVIVAAVALSGIVVAWAFTNTVRSATQAEVERSLGQQARTIARVIEREGIADASSTARSAQRFVGELRLVVRIEGEVVYFTGREIEVEARATGTSGPVEVQLERPNVQARVSLWLYLIFTLASLLFVATLVWGLSGTVARRLRRAVGEVADSAEEVTRGHFGTRVPESDDELGRLAQAFNRMTERLEAADARQREFLADVAHELRTPVTTIEGFAAALGDGTARTDEDRREATDFIRAETARLGDLVRDLHALTWLDLDPPVDREPVDLVAAGHEALALVGPRARAGGVRLMEPAGEAWALADPSHVATILGNLLTNALTATPAGGTIGLAAIVGPETVGLAVHDSGRGIAPEHLPYLFDRLYRADQARRRGPAEGGGSGLGLSIVRRLAGLQGGTVTVESAEGAGTTFTLTLVRAPRPVGTRPPGAARAVPGAR